MEPNNQNPQKSNGALVGVIIIIIILIVGGLYFAKMQKQDQTEDIVENEQQEATANNLSASDNLPDIETDLENNTNIDSLDQSLQ